MPNPAVSAVLLYKLQFRSAAVLCNQRQIKSPSFSDGLTAHLAAHGEMSSRKELNWCSRI